MRWCWLAMVAGCGAEGAYCESPLTWACDKRQECEAFGADQTYDDCMEGRLDPQALVCMHGVTWEEIRACVDGIANASCDEAEAAIASCLRWCSPC